jgi:4-hydroxy-4-methyl-2-oxoglutarate aldolase
VVEAGPGSGVGWHRPEALAPARFERLKPGLLDRLGHLTSIGSEVSDILDQLGLTTVVGGDAMQHRTGSRTVVGHALTLAYLPERQRAGPAQGRLAHHTVAAMAGRGDVLVVAAASELEASILGGQGAQALQAAGVAGAIVDGAIRDLEEIADTELGVWSRALSPRSGVGRLEATGINQAIACGGVQVRPGDLVVADCSGVAFVPLTAIPEVIERLLPGQSRSAPR